MGSRLSVLNHGLGVVPDLDAHTRNAEGYYPVGQYIPLCGLGDASGGLTLTANRLLAHLIVVTRAMTFDRIAIEVLTLEAGMNARLGIYNDSAFTPGSLLLDAGTVSVATTGVKTITINQQLTKGAYWLALYAQGSVAIIESQVRFNKWLGYLATDFSNIRGYCYLDGTYGALPDPFGAASFASTETSFLPLLRLASLD